MSSRQPPSPIRYSPNADAPDPRPRGTSCAPPCHRRHQRGTESDLLDGRTHGPWSQPEVARPPEGDVWSTRRPSGPTTRSIRCRIGSSSSNNRSCTLSSRRQRTLFVHPGDCGTGDHASLAGEADEARARSAAAAEVGRLIRPRGGLLALNQRFRGLRADSRVGVPVQELPAIVLEPIHAGHAERDIAQI